VDTPILAAFHICAWDRLDDDPSRPGMAGFDTPDAARGDRWLDSVPLLLRANEPTAGGAFTLIPPVRGFHVRAILHVHFYLAENGALIGHASRAFTIEDGHTKDPRDLAVIAGWPDAQTEDDLRKGIGTILLPECPLPHPTLVLYATAYGEDVALAASTFTTSAGSGAVRLHDLGRFRDPEIVGSVDGVGSSFSLAAYLNSLGEPVFTGPSQWRPALALKAANGLRAMLPEACRTFLTERIETALAAGDGRAPSVLISSDDLLFPWELVRVTTAADGPDARTLGQVAAVSRWLHHKPLPGHIRVARTAFIGPDSATIAPSVQADRDALANEEADAVRALAGEGADFRRIEPCTIPTVVQALDSSEFQVVHMRSHGTKYGVQLAAASGKYERAVFSLRPKHLPGRRVTRERNRPFICINICGGAFLESESWMGSLLEYGVGAAVVTLWNVASDLSKYAAVELYRGLGSGASIAEAIRAVRAIHSFDPPPPRGQSDAPYPAAMRINPTVLSYVVLGHPCAQVIPA
jgi:hypothetical protein